MGVWSPTFINVPTPIWIISLSTYLVNALWLPQCELTSPGCMRFRNLRAGFVWIVGTPQFAFTADYETVVVHLRKAWAPYLYLLVMLPRDSIQKMQQRSRTTLNVASTSPSAQSPFRRNLCITSRTKTLPTWLTRRIVSWFLCGIHCTAGIHRRTAQTRRRPARMYEINRHHYRWAGVTYFCLDLPNFPRNLIIIFQ